MRKKRWNHIMVVHSSLSLERSIFFFGNQLFFWNKTKSKDGKLQSKIFGLLHKLFVGF